MNLHRYQLFPNFRLKVYALKNVSSDTEAPKYVRYWQPADRKAPVCVAVAFSDNLDSSGMQFTYEIDGNKSDWTTYAQYCIDTLSAGNHTVTFQAKDRAGNASSTATESFSFSGVGN